ncbi:MULTISPECIES: hypothetical protein [unclassified Lactobacillus]|uniref:hypothetical protein n=1 Tax=unclassified Lactobacillus TaxID=2620435 RepID=UPI000EFCD1E0|nr:MULTISPECIES: hypothetical protein [unclassified Lactobacillus]RMC25519.1 hypothetical protein F5ESL0247_01535 [Lactobacillus sp. ESL0247]RMC29423.1 hypothetical protein F5ESL0246_01535 [Lactobacillus sp. ESL0246]RMC33152.1 hypothetical protein F5ESL0245_01535 [Lactobacillus sp. ESL0245]
MARLVKVGAGGGEIDWHDALKDLRADDVLLLEPGFYEMPPDILLSDITIKGTGNLPEETTILGYLNLAADSQFVNLENLCINTNDDSNSLFVPAEANTYLTLRNCLVKGYGNDTAVLAANGKVTLELYSTVILNGSVSLFADSDFRLEMNDSSIENIAEDFSALALEGHGTAIISNSRIYGSIDTFTKSNVELDLNNSVVDTMLLQGQVWLNMLNSKILSHDDTSLYITDESWVNIIASNFEGGIYLDKKPSVIIQNSRISRLVAVNDTQITLINTIILNHADFQDNAKCNVRRSTFNGGNEYQYFLALSDHAQLEGHDLILNSNGADLAVKDWAKMHASVLATSDESILVECSRDAKVQILGMKWTTRKN